MSYKNEKALLSMGIQSMLSFNAELRENDGINVPQLQTQVITKLAGTMLQGQSEDTLTITKKEGIVLGLSVSLASVFMATLSALSNELHKAENDGDHAKNMMNGDTLDSLIRQIESHFAKLEKGGIDGLE